MSVDLGLAIGESFAELLSVSAESASAAIRTRWYLPKRGLGDGLKEALKQLTENSGVGGGRIFVSTRAVERALSKGQGRSPALLISSGLNNWLKARQPFTTTEFSLRPARRSIPIEDDFVFGIDERISMEGEIETPLSTDDLEFLSSKLAMLKAKDVAIAFVNSLANPEHESQAASFLRDKGLRVVESRKLDTLPFHERARRAVESAYAESALLEEKEAIESAVKASEGNWELYIVTPGGPLPWNEHTALVCRGGAEAALSSRYSKPGLTLHCGFDGLSVFGTTEPSATASDETLKLSPTQLVGNGVWQSPQFVDQNCGYEPGPMLFGKSHQLSLLDILFVRGRLTDEVEAFTPLMSEKSRARILEALFTLGKAPHGASRNVRPPDAQEIAQGLEQLVADRLLALLTLHGYERGPIRATGPLAPAFVAVLKERKKTLTIKADEDESWAEALACAEQAKELA